MDFLGERSARVKHLINLRGKSPLISLSALVCYFWSLAFYTEGEAAGLLTIWSDQLPCSTLVLPWPQSMSSCSTWLLFTTLNAFCLCVFPVCTAHSKLVKNTWPWWVLTTRPFNPVEENGERLPEGWAMLVLLNVVWHSRPHPLRLCMTASVVTFLYFLPPPPPPLPCKKGQVWFSCMVTHNK